MPRCLPLRHRVLLLASMLLSSLGHADVYQCRIHGTLSFQDKPCPTGAPARKLQVTPTQDNLRPLPAHSNRPSTAASAPAPVRTTTSNSQYRCDGRTYCSQMTSCSEARFFLANCPNTRMDGDHDGRPCEQEWCKE